jgi:predicted nucleic acid-binding protein
MPDRLVIDASVVAKWFLSDEADKDAADKLLLLLLADEIEMSAPRVLLNNDMTYVGLAQELRCQWCTADRKFFQAVPADFPTQLAIELTSYGG